MMHDSIITSYNVDFDNKMLILYTENVTEKKEYVLVAQGVLTHVFENIIGSNIVLSIEESTIKDFFIQNKNKLEEGKKYSWPIDYEDRHALENFIKNNSYKYIKISASLGLCGWILAKEFSITDIRS